MNLVQSVAQLAVRPNGICLAMGVFDGLHIGHQSVIGCACEDAKNFGAASVVVTFDRHPNTVVAPQNVPPLIYPLPKKLEVIASLGVNETCVIPFDKNFSQIPGEQFIRELATKAVRSIAVGETFKFGHKRSGDVALLQRLGKELGFAVHALPDLSLDGQPVSSTRIRDVVRKGEIDLASRLLGRTYTLSGMIVSGAQLGRKLGFPTANLDVSNTVVPPAGVYAARAVVNGETHPAAVNIGHRPTVYSANEGLTVEAYLLDFSKNIYGEEIELTFRAKMRDEAKFDSLGALRQQIEKDVAAVRAMK